MRILSDQKGFSMLELVIVLVIIGVLAGVGVPKYLSMKAQADISADKANKSAIQTAVMNYYVDQINQGKNIAMKDVIKTFNQDATPFFPGGITPIPPQSPSKKYQIKLENDVVKVYY